MDPYPYADPASLLGAGWLGAGLDQVQDPRNLGAACRSAEAAGVSGVVIPERRSASVTGAVCKASAGAVEHLAIAQVRNLADWLAAAKEAGFWIWGADAEADQAHTATDLTGSTVIVCGGEESGLRPRVADNCDGLISLPQRGQGGFAERLGGGDGAAFRGGAQREARGSKARKAATRGQGSAGSPPSTRPGRQSVLPLQRRLHLPSFGLTEPLPPVVSAAGKGSTSA